MGFIQRLITAIRGGTRELGEAMLDGQDVRIYEQEIVDAKDAIKAAEEDLTGVMAKEMQAGREIERLSAEIAKYEEKALNLLNQGDEELVSEVAGKIAELESELETQQKAKATFNAHVSKIKTMIKQTHETIREHEREVAMVKTTANVQKATESISEHMDGGGSKLVAARDSLDRIKAHQADKADRMTAADELRAELSGMTLEQKLEAAGVGDNQARQESILERLKARAEKAGN